MGVRTVPFLSWVFLLLTFVRMTPAQDRSSQLSGLVTDQMGAVIPATRILLVNAAGKRYETRSDQDGRYRLSIPEGTYNVSAEHALVAWKRFAIPEYAVAYKAKMNLDVVLLTDAEYTRTHGTHVTRAPPLQEYPPVRDYLYFPTTLKKDKELASNAAKILAANPNATVTLVGHAKNKKSVSTRRLSILREFLITRHRISANRITTVYAGMNSDGPYTQIFVIDVNKSLLWRN
jgi:hypothetical protein